MNRRAHLRYFPAREATCQVGETGEQLIWRVARVQDISAGGIGLLLAREFEPGTILVVELMNQTFPRHLEARVVHAQPQGSNLWFTGCAFDGHLSENELQSLLS